MISKFFIDRPVLSNVLAIVIVIFGAISLDGLSLSSYATINLMPELQRLPGVGNVSVFGAGLYSMRIWLDPRKLYSYGLVPQDVISAIQSQNQQVSAGQVGQPPAPADQNFQ